jgi:predicted LPLAT superfamily acyltransferase
MTKQWQAQHERGNRFGLRLLTWAALHLGRRVIFFLLCFVVSHYFLVATKARKASREFLTRALQRPPTRWENYCHLLTFAIVSIDRIYFLSGREAMFDVRVHGNELFNDFPNRGCFLLTTHLGSFDVIRVMGMGERSQALPVNIVLDVQHNANALQLLQSLDPELASGVIDARTAPAALALRLSEAIAAGKLVGIMADRCTKGDRIVPLNFLGEPAHFPQGVWQLASILQAPVIMCFGLYKGRNRYDLHFELISEQLGSSRKDRGEAIAAGMFAYVNRIEELARENPFNWFNFYDFWQDK